MANIKRIISENAPKAVGPYVHATEMNGMVFVSGQLGIDPKIGKMVEGVEAQAAVSLQNLKAVLNEAGLGYENVLKTTVFLSDMADFPVVNQIYAEAFGEYKPARACIEVARLPMDGLVEIECIAAR